MKSSIFFLVLVSIFATACTKTPPQIFIAKADSPHLVGTYSGAEKLIRAVKGEAGAVVYGPYVNLEPGRYSATFDVTATAPTVGVSLGSVDVNAAIAANPDNKPIITVPLNSLPSPQKLAVEFSVTSRDAKYEFRVWSNGAGVVEYRGVEVKAVN